MRQTLTRNNVFTLFAAMAASVAIACVGLLALASPANADEEYYYVQFDGLTLYDDASLYGYPGESMTLKPSLYVVDSSYKSKKVKGVTFKWSLAKKLGAKTTSTKATIKKLPAAGTYKCSVSAYKNGKLLLKEPFKVVSKKKMTVKLVPMRDGKVVKSKTVKKNEFVYIDAKGAPFGWDNNKKKPFYVWTVKHEKSGKTFTWSQDKALKKNSYIELAPIGGGGNPFIGGEFKKAGVYNISVTLFHSDKKAATAKIKLTVK